MWLKRILFLLGEPAALETLVTPTAQGIASRVRENGVGSITLFAFDAGEELSEHTTPV